MQPQRLVHLFIHSSRLAAVIEQHKADSYVIVYVSTFRNKTGHYFNIILNDQPGVQKFQVADATDRDIASHDWQAGQYGYCKTFQFKYHLPGDHYARSIAVYVHAQDCKYKFKDKQRNIVDISAEFQTKRTEGYKACGISSYEDYQGVHYLSSFTKSNATVTPIYFERQGFRSFTRRLKKLSRHGYVTYYVGGTYIGEPGVGPTTFTMMYYQVKKSISKNSVKVLAYKNILGRHFSQELVQKAIAEKMKANMLPVSSIVWYKNRDDRGRVPTLYIVFVKEGLEFV